MIEVVVVLRLFVCDLVLGALDEVRMVAALAEFHHRVHQVRDVTTHRSLGKELEVPLKDRAASVTTTTSFPYFASKC